MADENDPRPGDIETALLRKILNRLAAVSGAGTKVSKAGDTMTGALLFSPDNTVDIGASGATRPRYGYFGTGVFSGAWSFEADANGGSQGSATINDKNYQFAGGIKGGSANILLYGGAHATTPNEIDLRQGTSIIWRVATASGHFLAGTDDTYDIGASGATRPRAVYVAGGVTAAAHITTSASFNAQVGTNYALVAGDNGKIVTLNNAGAITLTVPAGLAVGFSCTLIQLGAGQVTVTASGTTVNSLSSLVKLSGQHASAKLVSYSANVFNLSGALSA